MQVTHHDTLNLPSCCCSWLVACMICRLSFVVCGLRKQHMYDTTHGTKIKLGLHFHFFILLLLLLHYSSRSISSSEQRSESICDFRLLIEFKTDWTNRRQTTDTPELKRRVLEFPIPVPFAAIISYHIIISYHNSIQENS